MSEIYQRDPATGALYVNRHALAPFTEDQVHSLNAFQSAKTFHPFTCDNDSDHGPLVATTKGWTCAACDYTQNYALDWMADWTWNGGEKSAPAAQTVTLELEEVKQLFDLVVHSMDFGSGFLETDDVALLRRMAVAIGVDPMVGTPNEFKRNYPHKFDSAWHNDCGACDQPQSHPAHKEMVE